MSHKRAGARWSHRITLSETRADDIRLHEFLVQLAKQNEASQWIRAALLKAMTGATYTVGAGETVTAQVVEWNYAPKSANEVFYTDPEGTA